MGYCRLGCFIVGHLELANYMRDRQKKNEEKQGEGQVSPPFSIIKRAILRIRNYIIMPA